MFDGKGCIIEIFDMESSLHNTILNEYLEHVFLGFLIMRSARYADLRQKYQSGLPEEDR